MAADLPYRLTPLAKQDLRVIRDRVVEDNGAAVADRILAELEDSLHLLCEFPGMGRARPEFTDLPLSFWPFYSWFVVYDPASVPLEVVRVVSAERDVPHVL